VLLAFILSLVVWVSSVTANDPNEEVEYPRLIPIEVQGLDPNLLIVSELAESVRVTFYAPRSIQNNLLADEGLVNASLDLTNLGPGEHIVPVEVLVSQRPVRVTDRDPDEVHVVLESKITETISATLQMDGEPALGYQQGEIRYSPREVSVTGPESQVSKVVVVRGRFSIGGATQPITTNVQLQAFDANGTAVQNVTLTPDNVDVQLPISLLGGFRNVIVKVITSGEIANGYKLTNISVTPPTVLVFSTDPDLLNDLPGYVETEAVSLQAAQDDIEAFLKLNLPAGISVVGDDKALVQVNIAAIETTVRLSLPVEVIGLMPGLAAAASPANVDVILSGPVNILSSLDPQAIRVVVDMNGKVIGVYQEMPSAPFLPERIRLDSILPDTVEVTITKAPTPTATTTASPGSAATPTP
jgi:YbbR domain-containing protein